MLSHQVKDHEKNKLDKKITKEAASKFFKTDEEDK